MGGRYSRMTDNEQGNGRNMKDEVLRPIKRYFALTGQYWSFEGDEVFPGDWPVLVFPGSKAKRILYRVLQVVIACFVALYFVYTLGIFGSNKLPYILSYRFFNYPVATADNCMWEFRWLITCWLGILLTRRNWLETFGKHMKDIDLGEDRWKKVKFFSRTLVFCLIGMWLANVLQNLIEIDFKVSRQNALPIALDVMFNFVDRILAFPLFFLCCVTMYVLCCMVEEYRDDIEKWRKDEVKPQTNGDECTSPDKETSKDKIRNEATTSKASGDGQSTSGDEGTSPEENSIEDEKTRGNDESKNCGENSARERFRKIKAAIRIAGLSFESYLMVHFMLLLCTFFLGVCACFEQMEVRIAKGSENYTVQLFQVPHYARLINIYGNLSFDTDYTIGAPSTRSASMLTASKTISFTQTHGKDAGNGTNNTGKNQNSDDIQTKWVKQNVKIVAICSLVKTLESLLLYFLPISLMVRLQNRLRRVYEVIEDCNVEEQKKKELLFDNVEVIRRMCKYVKTANGLKIFGHTVPAFQTFILAAFGPFIAVITQRLLAHIHMKE